jgi:hypothetical protein
LVPRKGDTIHIPLKTDDALLALMKVKPTADMPRPSDRKKPSTAKKRIKRTK